MLTEGCTGPGGVGITVTVRRIKRADVEREPVRQGCPRRPPRGRRAGTCPSGVPSAAARRTSNGDLSVKGALGGRRLQQALDSAPLFG